MRARDRMRQEANRRRAQEFVADALGERGRGYDTPLFIRDEMAHGWRPVGTVAGGFETNRVYIRPVSPAPPALPAELWDKLTPPLIDLGDSEPTELELPNAPL